MPTATKNRVTISGGGESVTISEDDLRGAHKKLFMPSRLQPLWEKLQEAKARLREAREIRKEELGKIRKWEDATEKIAFAREERKEAELRFDEEHPKHADEIADITAEIKAAKERFSAEAIRLVAEGKQNELFVFKGSKKVGINFTAQAAQLRLF